jgi:uncharacterized cofD-like protein
VEVSAALELESFLAEQSLGPRGPRVVAIGGGHGLSAALKAIRTYASAVTAVVSVADDGGSSGRLTAGTGVPPPGDIRRALLALTPDRSVWSDLFAYRFPHGPDDPGSVESTDVLGHSLGNLILAALASLEGGFGEAVATAGRLLGAVGQVIPAAEEPLVLEARIGGTTVTGQVAVSRTRGGIESFAVGPAAVRASGPALEAIERADQIVIAPGSLFTSVIAAVAVPGIAAAIDRSSAQLTMILNLITQDAETLGMSGEEHVEAVHRHGGLRRRGTLIVDRTPLPVPLGLDRLTVTEGRGWMIRPATVAAIGSTWPEHDSDQLGPVLSGLV